MKSFLATRKLFIYFNIRSNKLKSIIEFSGNIIESLLKLMLHVMFTKISQLCLTDFKNSLQGDLLIVFETTIIVI